MSFGDPNNPYGPPPQQPPTPPQGYGYPQPPGVPPQAAQGYGYPQQPPAYGAYPGGANMMPYTMPGLMQTARVLLYIVAAAQILMGLFFMYIAATINDAANAGEDVFGDNSFSDVGHDGAGIVLVVSLLFLGLSALSITLGVKFTRGGQGIRITTMIYGILGALFGFLILIGAANNDTSAGLVTALLWIGFGGIMAAAMIAPSGAAWFNRPRY